MSNLTSNSNNDHICAYLSTLPKGSTAISQIQVDDVSIFVSTFVNLDELDSLAYFSTGTSTIIVDCRKISLLIF
ncbi:hypothetical protein [Sporosarcina sp. SAFN-015]|uniref:hypothetical protein n=1 Tax=Sporosarcina sp. SAFN-015 TaxID=3387274 RepID=UPI003F7F565F